MSDIYIYKYAYSANQKVLSSWSKFTFKGVIRSIRFFKSSLYAITVYNGKVAVEKLPLEEGVSDVEGFITHLDKRIKRNVAANNSTIVLPYVPKTDDVIQVYTTDGLLLASTRVGSEITLTIAPTENTDVYVGFPYTMKYTFSEQLFKARAGNGKTPSNAAKLMIRNGSLFYANSAFFKVKVTPKFRDTYENFFNPDIVGSTTIGSLSLDSGFYRFPVFTKAQDTVITIENDTALPSTFQSAEFESFLHTRSSRYA